MWLSDDFIKHIIINNIQEIIKNHNRIIFFPNYEWPAVIRAINTKDAMEATIEELPYDLLNTLVNRITSEVTGINRVLYDITPKPPGTIEWE